MFWLLLEAGIAGLLLVLIVWWTLPSKKKDQPPASSPKTGTPPEDGRADD